MNFAALHSRGWRRLALACVVLGWVSCEDREGDLALRGGTHLPSQPRVGGANRPPDKSSDKAGASSVAPSTAGSTDSTEPNEDSPAGSGQGGYGDRGPGHEVSGGAGAAHAGQSSGGSGSNERTRLVVIGDYGWSGPDEQQVAELVHELRPDYVLTTGDNNYPAGAAATIDENIGQYFSDFIFPYYGAYSRTATKNRFFPVLGNHDWYTEAAAAYLAYFTLPGNERYYDVVLGNVHFFALDSDANEPDGVTAASVQGRWLERALGESTSPFNVVAMHHPPFSSGPHGNSVHMQWPYAEWGADLVVAGHDHCYERLQIGNLTYLVSGLGGASLYSIGEPVPGSRVRYNESHGVTLLEATKEALVSSFFDVDGNLVDAATIRASSARAR